MKLEHLTLEEVKDKVNLLAGAIKATGNGEFSVDFSWEPPSDVFKMTIVIEGKSKETVSHRSPVETTEN